MSSIHDLEYKNGVCALVGMIEDAILCFKSYKIDLEVVIFLMLKIKYLI
jgi:hypothetical protein